MKTFLARLLWEFKFQYRYYFWITGAVVTLMWLLLLSALSESVRATWLPVLIFADIGNIGLLFIAGILYLELRQGTVYVASIMPVPPASWLRMKLLSLSVLCGACALAMVYFYSESVNWLRIIPAALLSGALFTSLGFLLVAPFEKILNYFFGMAVGLTLLNIPMLDYLGIYSHELMWLLPTQPAMKLLAGSFHEMSNSAYALSMLVLAGWILLTHVLGVKAFQRIVCTRPQL